MVRAERIKAIWEECKGRYNGISTVFLTADILASDAVSDMYDDSFITIYKKKNNVVDGILVSIELECEGVKLLKEMSESDREEINRVIMEMSEWVYETGSI
jgi:hypothetical protein